MKELIFVESQQKIADNKDTPYIFVNDFTVASSQKFYLDFRSAMCNPKIKIIPIIINSYGGQVHSLLSMIDIIEHSNKPVATIGMGATMSCGAVLLACGSPGYRYAAPNTDIMIHEVSSSTAGTSSDITNTAKHTDYLNKKLFQILANRTTKNKQKDLLKKIKNNANVDWHLGAEEYKQMGLIDHAYLPNLT